MPKLVKSIAHTALTVSDMEASLKFYREALGFEKAFETHDANDNPWIVYIYVGSDQFLELFYAEPGQEKAQGAHRVQVPGRVQLAKVLECNRSALTREIGRMEDEGILVCGDGWMELKE